MLLPLIFYLPGVLRFATRPHQIRTLTVTPPVSKALETHYVAILFSPSEYELSRKNSPYEAGSE